MQSKGSLPSARLATLAVAVGLSHYFVGCRPVGLGPGVQDFSAVLLDGYTLNRTSAHQIYISDHGGLGADVPQIPTKVLECAVHPPYILARRQRLRPRSFNDPYMLPDPDVFDYWILDTRAPGQSFGPMDLGAFSAKRRDFKIPDEVVLKDVYSLRK